MRQWRLIYDSPSLGTINMARDEALLKSVALPDAVPTLRLYAWEPHCLSLGYGQRVRDVDQMRLEEKGWGLVRRPTGGKAILHGDELTYSVTLPHGDELAQGDIVESYRLLSGALIEAMRQLGLLLESEMQPKGNNGLGPVCFEVPSHYEITANDKKLIGSAQVRRKSGILQHGTIPLYGDISRICDVLAYPDDTQREAAKAHVRQRATTLEAVAGRCIGWDEVASALVAGFISCFDVTFIENGYSRQEHEDIEKFLDERYENRAWINKR